MATSSGRRPELELPDLDTVLADKKEYELKLALAKANYSRLDSEIQDLRLGICTLKKEFGDLDKSENFYQSKYDANMKLLLNLQSRERKYGMNKNWFKNYEQKMSTVKEDVAPDTYAEAIKQKEDTKKKLQALTDKEQELSAQIESNDLKYSELKAQLRSMDILDFIK